MKICKIDDCDSIDLATRSSMCKEHHREYNRQHYKDNKQYYVDKAAKNSKALMIENRKLLIEFLLKNPCVDCGNNDPEVLQFDHTDATIKTYNVSNMLKHTWNAIEKEIAKCMVRCANCHQKKTRRQFGYWIIE